MQELYTRTFEINPVCALEVGWQLFGERYERGTFIVKMRQTLRDLDLPESTELPDHLPHVLQALDRLNQEEAAQFAQLFVSTAVKKMIDGFKDNNNIYRDILNGILCEVRSQYNLPAQGAQDD
jgi:nitrate reductase delta subunit